MFNLQVLGGQNFVLLGKANVSCCPRAMHRESTGIQLRICSVEAFAVTAHNGNIQWIRVCFPFLWCPAITPFKAVGVISMNTA